MSNYIVLEQTAPAQDQDTWHGLREQALAGLNGRGMQSTSDETSGLLAYVEHHLEAHHSPDVFHVQQELSKAGAAPMAAKQQAANKVVVKAVHNFFLTRPDGTTTTEGLSSRSPGRCLPRS